MAGPGQIGGAAAFLESTVHGVRASPKLSLSIQIFKAIGNPLLPAHLQYLRTLLSIIVIFSLSACTIVC